MEFRVRSLKVFLKRDDWRLRLGVQGFGFRAWVSGLGVGEKGLARGRAPGVGCKA